MASSFNLVFILSVTSGLFIAGTMSATDETDAQDPRCPPGWTWFGSRCFMYVHTPKQWVDAEHHCISAGGNLASIHSADENAFLRDYIARVTGYRKHAWIGGHDAVRENTWLWSDGTRFDYARWSLGEPNNFRTEHCIEMNWGGNFWNDNRCHYHKSFVCARDESQ